MTWRLRETARWIGSAVTGFVVGLFAIHAFLDQGELVERLVPVSGLWLLGVPFLGAWGAVWQRFRLPTVAWVGLGLALVVGYSSYYAALEGV